MQEKITKSLWKFDRKTILSDIAAGLTGAVAGAPQAMGFAIVAGISPLYGLYAAFIAPIIGSLFANSTMMTIAPTNALAIVVGSTLMSFNTNDQIAYLFMLTFLVGVWQVAFGVLRLGNLTRFVSNAVMTGFITGAGLLVILGQLNHLTGYETQAHGVLPRFIDLITHLNQSDLYTSIIGIMATLIIYYLHHTRFSSMATLIAMIITSILVTVLGWESVPLVRDMSPIPSALPGFVMPHFEYASSLLSAAFALAVLSSVQSAALVANITEPDGRDSDDNRDLLGQGLANMVASLFQGMPSGGSLSRTAVNITAGAKTRFANILAGIFVGLTLLFLGTAIEHITLAALAGHLVVAAMSLIRPKAIATVWRVSWIARLSMLATFISTLVLPLEYSIYIGVGLSLALYIYSSAAWIQVVHLVKIGEHQYKEDLIPKQLPENKAIVFSIYGNMFFAAVRRLQTVLPDPETANHTAVILRLRNNPYMGSTGLRFFYEYAEKLGKHNSILILTGVGDNVAGQLERTEPPEDPHLFKIFTADGTVFSATEKALDYAKEWLHSGDEEISV